MKRAALIAIGWASLGLGVAGAVLPVLPTVPFLLLTAACWARSSERLHTWLYGHPTWGPPLRDWRAHGAIPPRAKLAAVAMIAISITGSMTAPVAWPVRAVAVVCCAASLVFIVTRPDGPAPAPAESRSSPG